MKLIWKILIIVGLVLVVPLLFELLMMVLFETSWGLWALFGLFMLGGLGFGAYCLIAEFAGKKKTKKVHTTCKKCGKTLTGAELVVTIGKRQLNGLCYERDADFAFTCKSCGNQQGFSYHFSFSENSDSGDVTDWHVMELTGIFGGYTKVYK